MEKYRQQIYNAYINDTNEFKETLRYILSGKAYEEVDKRLEENDFWRNNRIWRNNI